MRLRLLVPTERFNFKMVTKNSRGNTQQQYLSKGIYESHPLNLTSNPTITLQDNKFPNFQDFVIQTHVIDARFQKLIPGNYTLKTIAYKIKGQGFHNNQHPLQSSNVLPSFLRYAESTQNYTKLSSPFIGLLISFA